MINLLKTELPQNYGITRPNIRLNTRIASGRIEEGDYVSCKSCKRETCNQKIMIVDAENYNITIVEHEDYVCQFNGKVFANGGRCDYLLFDDRLHKLVFCELGCYSEEYVEKKKAVAHKQVTESLQRLLDKPSGVNVVSSFRERQLVFFRRDPNLQSQTFPARGDVSRNFQAFINNPATTSAYLEADEKVKDCYGNSIDVKFVIVNYPSPYRW